MQLVPIETIEHVNGTFPVWFQFLPDIAKRTKEPVADLVAKVANQYVQPILIWDEFENKAVALLGIQYHYRGNERIAEWVWMTGKERQRWQDLLPKLEQYLKEHEGCAVIRPICRFGWVPYLKQHGYRPTHIMMEKVL